MLDLYGGNQTKLKKFTLIVYQVLHLKTKIFIIYLCQNDTDYKHEYF